MPDQPPPGARICGNCDGFPVVAIDSGLRRSDGTRLTLKVVCHVCDGHGTLTRPVAVTVGASC
ncbi:hypothetical protein AB0M28_10760 [Streptomyces sp. NPDC051940]|uniref:hypothetical protein n=1 Tax=Streptomyces sp. NPDC051940 TaxID=3155675 RepID=UPI003443FB99